MRLIEQSDVGLLPSLDDTFGWSALEAMSQGLPVVGTNICALPEIIISDFNGMTIPDQFGRQSPLGRFGDVTG